MCRNIKPLFNFDPPATRREIDNASLQFVRKISGFQNPSYVNEKVFNEAVRNVSKISMNLLRKMKTNAKKKSRIVEARKAKLRAIKRFGK